MAAGDFVQEGARLTYTNSASADLSAGDPVLLGSILGVCLVDIASGDSGEVDVKGVFTLTKTAGTAWTVGTQLYWDATAGSVTTVAGANKKCGTAAAIAALAATTGNVNLNLNG